MAPIGERDQAIKARSREAPVVASRANAKTVWEIGGENDNLHPTQKPLEVFLRPIEYHTETGDVVFAPFLSPARS